MRYIAITLLIWWALAVIMIAHKAIAAEGLPPYLKSEQPGKMCVAIFDKFNEFVGIDCDVPEVEESGNKDLIRKGP